MPLPVPGRSKTLVIVPAWNEEGSIGATIAELRAAHPEVDVLVVDDGSGDSTAAIAEGAGALVARLPYNLGVGGAMRAGYRYALRHGYAAAVQLDADGQHDPAYLPALLSGLDHADIVVGARFALYLLRAIAALGFALIRKWPDAMEKPPRVVS